MEAKPIEKGGTRMVHVGKTIVNALEAQGVERTFIVPGESFLPVLDGLHDSSIDTVVCRQEGGAAYMAEAQGKATGKPGVAMVTRGPGASNAFVAIHAAWQDCTPMVLFVGLIPFSDRDRESFQEFDPKAWFGTQAKQVFVLDDPSAASRVVADAFFQASTGRPGPVVVGLPEDVLYEEFEGTVYPPRPVSRGGVSQGQRDAVEKQLASAKRPLIYAGGPGWDQKTSRKLAEFADAHNIPVVHDWRATDRIAFSAAANAGWLGYGRDENVARLLDDADVLLQVGAVLTDVPTDGYTLRQSPDAVNIIALMDTALRGHSGAVTEHIVASPAEFVDVLATLDVPVADEKRYAAAHQAHLDFAAISQPDTWCEAPEGTAHLEEVFRQLQEQVGDDGIYTFGAGDHCIWAQRFLRTEQFPSQLGMRNGSMGYSVPAAVAAALEFPERTVVTIAGDGEYLMNGQELATAVQEGTAFLAVTVTNGQYSTIRGHQEKHFPGRVSGTQMVNPDFAEVAKAYGGHGELVTADDQVAGAIERALRKVREERVPAIVNVIVAQELGLPE